MVAGWDPLRSQVGGASFQKVAAMTETVHFRGPIGGMVKGKNPEHTDPARSKQPSRYRQALRQVRLYR